MRVTLERWFVVALVAAAGPVATGCATSGMEGTSPAYYEHSTRFFTPTPDSRTIYIRNNSWNRVTVYMIRAGGEMLRLGDVESFQTVAFGRVQVVDDGSGIRFFARPLARPNGFQSESFLFPLGSSATWNIENNPDLSHVIVR